MKAAVIINSPKQVGCVQLVQSAFREKACSSIDSGSVTNVYAQMAESVDALVSNTSGAIRAGSTPALGTFIHLKVMLET